MSPSWRERVLAALTPRRVLLLRQGRGLAPRLTAREQRECAPADPGMPPWQPAVLALRTALNEPAWQNAELRLVLSNHFVHYLMVPWSTQLTKAAEQAALVRHHFSQVFGTAADSWEMRWSEGKPPAPCLACGVDKTLLAALRELAADPARRLRLGAVQPYLMAAYNRWRRQLDGRQDWLLLAEEGRICLGWFEDKDWAGVFCQQVGGDWENELPGLLERALLLAGREQAPRRLSIEAPGLPAERLALAEGWSGSLLKTRRLATADSAYAMALAA